MRQHFGNIIDINYEGARLNRTSLVISNLGDTDHCSIFIKDDKRLNLYTLYKHLKTFGK